MTGALTTRDWLAGRRVCVAGTGVTGSATVRALLGLGARVVLVDERDGERQRAAAGPLADAGAEVRLGAATGLPAGVELVVTSPGWRPDRPLLAAAGAAGVPVWGDIELAWRLRDPDHAAPWLALTGTNGKTTTVEMLASILRADGRSTLAVGNVGTPLYEAVLAGAAYDVLAVELSSFQLHWSTSVVPYAGAVLNVAADHLDWHGSLAAYADDKARIWAPGTVAVGNAQDAEVMRRLPAGGRTFSLAADADYALVDGALVERASGTELARADDVRPAGAHNVANALAAAALARAYGVAPTAVADGLRTFAPGHHRNEPVAEAGGVAYVDDSKATNPHAAEASLAAYPSVVWVAGGQLKGAPIDDLVAAHARRLRGAVVMGQDRAQFLAALARHAPDVRVVEVDSTDTGAMRTAVREAAGMARPGDTVLLAPAGASLDMFRDYAERGELFAAAARELAGEAG